MSKSDTRTSLLELLQEIQKEHDEKGSRDTFYNHVAICLEVGDDGFPKGKMIHVKGAPYEVLGMVELAIAELQAVKDKIMDRFDTGSDNTLETGGGITDKLKSILKRGMGEAPPFLKKIIEKYNDELGDALRSGDSAKINELRDKIQNEAAEYMNEHGLGNSDDDDDDDKGFDSKKGFDINNFK